MTLDYNMLVEWKDADGNNQIERVLWEFPSGDTVFIPVLGQKAWPFMRSAAEVSSALERNNVKILGLADYSSELKRALEVRPKLSDTQQACQNNAWKAVSVLVLDEKRRLFLGSERSGRLIRRWAKKIGVDRTTLYRYLRRYWQRGQNIDALQSDLRLCGGPGTRHKRGEVKLGRKTANGKHVGINITLQDEEYFKEAIERYHVGKGFGPGMTFDAMLKDHYSIIRPHGGCELKPDEQLPTPAQFKYFFRRQDQNDLLKRKEGELTYARKYRGLLGNQSKQALTPGALYQIDSTVADLYLVSSVNPRIVVGRPTLYLVVDTFSTMIVGFHVGFDNASYNTASLALWNAYREKVALCKEYGVNITEAHWPARGLPTKILADRGELLSNCTKELVNRLGIGVANTAPYRADAKGMVESHFNRCNKKLIHWLPGAVNKTDERPTSDYRKEATLNVRQFIRGLILAILEFNQSIRPKYGLSTEMISAGFGTELEPRPVNLWSWGIRNLVGMRPHMDDGYVRTALLPTIEGKIEGHGLRVEDNFYTWPAGVKADIFGYRRRNGVETVTCHYDPYRVDNVLLLGKTVQDVIVCEMTNRNDGHLGYSWEEYRAWHKEKLENERNGWVKEAQRRVDFSAMKDAIEAEAAAAVGDQPVDVKQIKEAKEDERAIQRAIDNAKTAALIGIRETPVPELKLNAPDAHKQKAQKLLDEIRGKTAQQPSTQEKV